MLNSNPDNLSTKEYINQLEDLYAECLRDNADSRILDQIWNKIKELKQQLKTDEGKS
jgi:hypothetical protein